MKKRIVIFIAVLVSIFICLSLILPSPDKIVVNKNIKASSQPIYRAIADQQTWDKLFPGNFTVTKKLLNTVHINYVRKAGNAAGSIFLIPLSVDSTLVTWTCDVPGGNNFFNRISRFIYGRTLVNKLSTALDSVKAFSMNTTNTYGIDIITRSTKDTSLITTRFQTSAYPTEREIYSYIEKLVEFANANDAKQTGYPMLNVSTYDSSEFRCMVALPIDRKIKTDPDSKITAVRMVPGDFLTAEVKGGPYTIKNAHAMMSLYFQEYKRIAMAIPFEYLVTDRINEPDTSKWITRIYVPVY